MRLEIEQALEYGDPLQLVYKGIQRETGDGYRIYTAFSIHRIEE